MRIPPITIVAPAAAGWTLLYVASKVHYALTDTLGVSGGPTVPATHYAAYGPGEVAAAQWANAAVGLAAAGLLLLAAWFPRRWNRWVLTVPTAALFLMAVAGAVGMTARDLLTGSGGALFGVFCAVWALLVGMTTWIHHRTRTSPATLATR